MPVNPLQINFPCIRSVAEIKRKSINKSLFRRISG